MCSRKKILLSDPRVKEMNKTRWLYEGWQVRLEEEAKAKLIVQVGTEAVNAMRSLLCAILGLNLEPIAEPDPEKPGEHKYRWPKDGEFTPLIMAIARPDYIQQAMEKVGKIVPELMQEGAEGIPAPLATEEDLEFFDDLDVDEKKAFWDSLEMRQQHAQYVIPVDPNTVDPTAKEQPKPPGLTDADREELMRSRSERVPSKMKFSIEPDVEDFEVEEPK